MGWFNHQNQKTSSFSAPTQDGLEPAVHRDLDVLGTKRRHRRLFEVVVSDAWWMRIPPVVFESFPPSFFWLKKLTEKNTKKKKGKPGEESPFFDETYILHVFFKRIVKWGEKKNSYRTGSFEKCLFFQTHGSQSSSTRCWE